MIGIQKCHKTECHEVVFNIDGALKSWQRRWNIAEDIEKGVFIL